MSVTIEPLRDMVVIQPVATPQKPSPIIQVEFQQQPAARGLVLAVGPDVQDIQAGQRVVFSRLQGYEVTLGDPVIVLREGAILATE